MSKKIEALPVYTDDDTNKVRNVLIEEAANLLGVRSEHDLSA